MQSLSQVGEGLVCTTALFVSTLNASPLASSKSRRGTMDSILLTLIIRHTCSRRKGLLGKIKYQMQPWKLNSGLL
jgi:hypothetical protein